VLFIIATTLYVLRLRSPLPARSSSPSSTDDLPIALRQGKHNCTQHPIAHLFPMIVFLLACIQLDVPYPLSLFLPLVIRLQLHLDGSMLYMGK